MGQGKWFSWTSLPFANRGRRCCIRNAGSNPSVPLLKRFVAFALIQWKAHIHRMVPIASITLQRSYFAADSWTRYREFRLLIRPIKQPWRLYGSPDERLSRRYANSIQIDRNQILHCCAISDWQTSLWMAWWIVKCNAGMNLIQFS